MYLMYIGPREYLNFDFFEMNKKTFITITNMLYGLIVGQQLKNRQYHRQHQHTLLKEMKYI